MLAAMCNNVDAVHVLLRHGANAHVVSTHGRTALHKVTKNQMITIFMFQIFHIFQAALFGNELVVKALVNRDPALALLKDNFGEEAVDCARFANAFGCVDALSSESALTPPHPLPFIPITKAQKSLISRTFASVSS
jgi:creatinine amidohydrolase/Fe(II)-dependent formamide hydrolase-like protein